MEVVKLHRVRKAAFVGITRGALERMFFSQLTPKNCTPSVSRFFHGFWKWPIIYLFDLKTVIKLLKLKNLRFLEF